MPSGVSRPRGWVGKGGREHVADCIFRGNARAKQLLAVAPAVVPAGSEVVGDSMLRALFFREGDAEIAVEIVSDGRDPFETRVHSCRVRENLAERCLGDRHDCDVTMDELPSRAVYVPGLQGAARTGGISLRRVRAVLCEELFETVYAVGQVSWTPSRSLTRRSCRSSTR